MVTTRRGARRACSLRDGCDAHHDGLRRAGRDGHHDDRRWTSLQPERPECSRSLQPLEFPSLLRSQCQTSLTGAFSNSCDTTGVLVATHGRTRRCR